MYVVFDPRQDAGAFTRTRSLRWARFLTSRLVARLTGLCLDYLEAAEYDRAGAEWLWAEGVDVLSDTAIAEGDD